MNQDSVEWIYDDDGLPIPIYSKETTGTTVSNTNGTPVAGANNNTSIIIPPSTTMMPKGDNEEELVKSPTISSPSKKKKKKKSHKHHHRHNTATSEHEHNITTSDNNTKNKNDSVVERKKSSKKSQKKKKRHHHHHHHHKKDRDDQVSKRKEKEKDSESMDEILKMVEKDTNAINNEFASDEIVFEDEEEYDDDDDELDDDYHEYTTTQNKVHPEHTSNQTPYIPKSQQSLLVPGTRAIGNNRGGMHRPSTGDVVDPHLQQYSSSSRQHSRMNSQQLQIHPSGMPALGSPNSRAGSTFQQPGFGGGGGGTRSIHSNQESSLQRITKSSDTGSNHHTNNNNTNNNNNNNQIIDGNNVRQLERQNNNDHSDEYDDYDGIKRSIKQHGHQHHDVEGSKTRRVVDQRHITLYYAEDVGLFDKIVEFRKNTGGSKDEALNTFGPCSRASDSIVQLVYGVDSYDYILKYDSTDRRQSIRDIFEQNLLLLGIFLEYESIESTTKVFIKLVTPFHALCHMAQVHKLRLPLNKTYRPIPYGANKLNPSKIAKALDIDESLDLNDQSAVFQTDRLHLFRGVDSGVGIGVIQSRFFKPFHRSLLTRYLVESACVNNHPNPPSRIGLLLADGVYKKFYYLHDQLLNQDEIGGRNTNLRVYLYKHWVKNLFGSQPLDAVREYFGERVALYFAFCGFYKAWLAVYSIFGFVVFVYGLVDMQRAPEGDPRPWSRIYDNPIMPYYALFGSLWANLFFEFWTRRNNYLAFKWGVFEFEKVEVPRFDFRPTDTKLCLVTGRDEPHFPTLSRRLRQFTTFFVVSFMLVLVGITLLVQIAAEVYLQDSNMVISASFLLALLGLIFVELLRRVYIPLSKVLNEWENYETNTEHIDARIKKIWSFCFVNIFLRLFYLAFFRPYLTQNHHMCIGNCTTDVFMQIAVLFIGEILITRTEEILVPYLLRKYKKWKSTSNGNPSSIHPRSGSLANTSNNRPHSSDASITRAGKGTFTNPQHFYDDKLPVVTDEAEQDYLQKVNQYSILTLFSAIFPLAPIIAFCNNTFEIHSDAYKYLVLYQRYTPIQAQDIGSWYGILRFLSILAITTNAFIVSFLSRSFEETYLQSYPVEEWFAIKFGVVISWHVVVYVCNFAVCWAIPDVPRLVRIAQQRQIYLERIIVSGGDGSDSDEEGSI